MMYLSPMQGGMPMYTENDLTAIRAQQKKRWLTLLIPELVLIAALVYSLIVRSEILTDVLTLLAGTVLIAGYDLFIKPLHRYEIHLNNVLHGIVHDLDAEFGGISEDLSEVDGVVYRTLTVVCYDEKNKPYDRTFYYDNEKPVPTFTPGQMLHLVYHDHELASVTAA